MLGFTVIRTKHYPAWQKAHKLARCLTEAQIEDLFSGRVHVHKNPKKRDKLRVTGSGQAIGQTHTAALLSGLPHVSDETLKRMTDAAIGGCPVREAMGGK